MKDQWKRAVERQDQLGLGIEYLRMLAIPTCLFALLLNGFWVLGQWLQHQPIPRLQATLWALASTGALMELIWLPNRKWLIIVCSVGQILLMSVFLWTSTYREPLALPFTVLLLSLHATIVAVVAIASTQK